MKWKLLTTLLLVFFVYQSIFAQEKEIIKSNQQWSQYYNTTKLSEKWSLDWDTGFRWKNSFKDRSKLFLRAGIAYKINPHIKGLIGASYNGIYTDNDLNRSEFRIYQQISIKHQYNEIKTQHRFRVEQRNFYYQDREEKNFNHRFRYRISVAIPLFTFSKQETSPKFFLNLADEIFINTGREIISNVFAANRVLISPTVQVNQNLTFLFTYNYTFASTQVPYEYRHIDIFLLAVKHKMDWSK